MSERYEYERVAAKIGEEIAKGTRPPGSMLPSIRDLMATYKVSKTTMENVIRLLSDRGLVRAERGRGTVVLDRQGGHPTRVRVTQSAAAPAPEDDDLEDWEAACAEQERTGALVTVAVSEGQARDDVAARLQLADTGRRVIRRFKHARLDGRPAQLQTAFYPVERFGGTPFAEEHRLTTGTYAAMRELGFTPANRDEVVSARGATPEEAVELRIRPGSPVLVIERLTRDDQGVPLELLRIVADSLRTELAYEDLPLPRP